MYFLVKAHFNFNWNNIINCIDIGVILLAGIMLSNALIRAAFVADSLKQGLYHMDRRSGCLHWGMEVSHKDESVHLRHMKAT